MATNSNAGGQSTKKTNAGRTEGAVRPGGAGSTGRTGGTARSGGAGNTVRPGGTVRAAGQTGNVRNTGGQKAENKIQKKNRRLKRSIRKTLGALFLVSALVIAAIPTEGLHAEPVANHGGDSVSVNVLGDKKVPTVSSGATIYSHFMDGITFRFAYVSPSGEETGNNRYAVILGYEQVGNLPGGVLDIPDHFEAYRRYYVEGVTTGNSSQSAAVNRNNEFLYYMKMENKLDANMQPIPELDANGQPVKDSAGNIQYQKEPVYYPCFYSSREVWASERILYVAEKGADNKLSYKQNDVSTPRISDAQVSYIGSQYLREVKDNPNKEFEIAGVVNSANNGVFSDATNITTLRLPDSIAGIGDYAFANCGFATVVFGNGLNCLGNYAFLGCGSMTQVNFDLSCGMLEMGEGCFQDCGALPSIDLPGHVQRIGNFAFQGCSELKNVNMIYPDYENSAGISTPLYGTLTKLGQNVFMGCSKLQYLEFPTSYTDPVDVSEFQGCTSLEYIRSGFGDVGTNGRDGNGTFTLKEGDWANFGWDKFIAQCPMNDDGTESRFYLWGARDSRLHEVATAQKIAFKFYDANRAMNVYEKVVPETDEKGEETGATANYWVNENNELISCRIDNNLHLLVLPETIGPKNINSIGSGTFQNKCNLFKVTIPASVRRIADNAFKGCHNLKWVIFTNAESVSSIGQGAFDTQGFTATHLSGSAQGGQASWSCTTTDLAPVWYLNFVGTISNNHVTTVPFRYAMSDRGSIGLGTSKKTYLTYFSGFPTHLVVRRNETTRSNELIDYPTYNDLRNGRYTEIDPKTGYAYYAYMSQGDIGEMEAIQRKLDSNDLTPYQREIVDSVLNLRLPDGIESIATVDISKMASGGKAELVDDALTGSDVAADNDNAMGLGKEDSTKKGLFNYRENNVGTDLLVDRVAPYVASGSTFTDSYSAEKNGLRKTLTTENVHSFTPGAFRDCDAFKSISLEGEVQAVGHYAFADCGSLEYVGIAESVSKLGRVPFINAKSGSDTDGSAKAVNVVFNGSKNYTCENSIIYQLDSSGKKYRLEEYLYARSPRSVAADEVSSVSEIAPEAFRETGINSIDFGQSSIGEVPEDAFRGAKYLDSVTLPTTCKVIGSGAFSDAFSNPVEVKLRIPASVNVISNQAFEGVDANKVFFITPENSTADAYARNQVPPFHVTHAEDPEYCTVRFMSTIGYIQLGDTLTVLRGGTVTAPQVPDVDGKFFAGWMEEGSPNNVTQDTKFEITKDTIYYAVYEDIKADTYKVTFLDWDSSLLREVTVVKGGNAGDYAPNSLCIREGYRHTGWDRPINNVTENITTKATYEKVDPTVSSRHTLTIVGGHIMENGNSSGSYDEGTKIIITANAPAEGRIFDSWSSLPVLSATTILDKANSTTAIVMPSEDITIFANFKDVETGGNAPGTDGRYSLTVQGGSGSGSYKAGEQVIITADPPAEGKKFSEWTFVPTTAALLDKTKEKTVLTMPESNVTILANYTDNGGSGNPTPSPGPGNPGNPTPSPGPGNPGNPTPSPGPATMRSLMVYNGSGSGMYLPGQQIIVVANDPPVGKEFSNWTVSPAATVVTDKNLSAIVVSMPDQDVALVANYKDISGGSGNTPAPSSPTPAPGDDNGDDNGGDGDGDDNDGGWGDTELFTLTVQNGSGSGTYMANSQPVIVADQASSTQVFDHWTIQPEQALISSLTQSAAVITMPHCDVIVTAHYRAVQGGADNNPVNPVNTYRPSGGNTNVNTGGSSTVVIDKNGLSNTGVVSVAINGSSDNFIIKVAENSSATEAILRALLAEYGNLDNIKYFPMDITLYDSTGSRRITDTTGLKIDITLPLPDSLRVYAGNNKVAGVVNDRLDKLSPKFTTINGVPCVTFSAEHFSPYVIYVDTSRLGQGSAADNTPKTGDAIHPKWFLSIGLACLSLVMFMQKDTKKKRKVAVRAK